MREEPNLFSLLVYISRYFKTFSLLFDFYLFVYTIAPVNEGISYSVPLINITDLSSMFQVVWRVSKKGLPVLKDIG